MTHKVSKFLLVGLMVLFCWNASAQDATFTGLPVFQANQQPGNAAVPNDVNGNGISDILWFNPTSNQFGYWLMSVNSNGDVSRAGARVFNITPGYSVAATSDFNGDGKADLVWTSQNHDLYLWASSATGFESSFIDTYPAGWNLIGAGDVDGDGKPDLLWWNSTTHQLAYWLMKGGKRVGSRVFNIASGYQVVAIGYFGASNRISLVWAGAAGDLYDWDSNGLGFDSYYVGSIARAYDAYSIEGVALLSGGYLQIRTASATDVETYEWVRQFDDQGVQQSARFTNGASGGRFPNEHISGFVYCPQFTGNYQSPLFIKTDVSDPDRTPTPAYLTINGPYQGAFGLNQNDSFATGFPVGWYVIGADWYQTGRRAYGPTPSG